MRCIRNQFVSIIVSIYLFRIYTTWYSKYLSSFKCFSWCRIIVMMPEPKPENVHLFNIQWMAYFLGDRKPRLEEWNSRHAHNFGITIGHFVSIKHSQSVMLIPNICLPPVILRATFSLSHFSCCLTAATTAVVFLCESTPLFSQGYLIVPIHWQRVQWHELFPFNVKWFNGKGFGLMQALKHCLEWFILWRILVSGLSFRNKAPHDKYVRLYASQVHR